MDTEDCPFIPIAVQKCKHELISVEMKCPLQILRQQNMGLNMASTAAKENDAFYEWQGNKVEIVDATSWQQWVRNQRHKQKHLLTLWEISHSISNSSHVKTQIPWVKYARWYSAVCWRGQAFWPHGLLLMFTHNRTCCHNWSQDG